MTHFLLTSTLLMGTALLLAAVLPAESHEARRRMLLGGLLMMVGLPLLSPLLARHAWTLDWSWESGQRGPASAEGGDSLLRLWMAGALISLGSTAWKLMKVRALVLNSRRLSTAQQRRIVRALPAVEPGALRRIRWSSGVLSPCVVPGREAQVLLPWSALGWDRRTLGFVLRHEWEHVRRGDVWWRLFAEMLRAAWWFHPLAYWLVHCWAEECERVCDAAVLRDGAAPADYARTLLALASGGRGQPAAISFSGRRTSRLRSRVEAVLKDRPSGATRGGVLGWLALAFLILLGCGVSLLRFGHAPSDSNRSSLVKAEAQLRLEANPFPGNEAGE